MTEAQNPDDEVVEACFLIPITEDVYVGSGEIHPECRWEAFEEELFIKFSGLTRDTSLKIGFYQDPNHLSKVSDMSREYQIDLRVCELENLKEFLRGYARVFRQKCIRFVVASKVEYLKGVDENEND